MLMVIFGAGASYDSSPTYPSTARMAPPDAAAGDMNNGFFRPPLAKGLFQNWPVFRDAIEMFPECKPVIPRLQAVPDGSTIETVLQEIQEEASTYQRGFIELAAVRCYLQRAVSRCEAEWNRITRGITNYGWLCRDLQRLQSAGGVHLVTFNYDTLLEGALGQFGFVVRSLDDYMHALGPFRLYKLHGSVNWARPAHIYLPETVNLGHPPSVLKYLIEHPDRVQLSEKQVVLCDPANMGVVDGGPAFPAIAIPTATKGKFECPDDIIGNLISILPSITKIAVIGWRATEAHFLDLLRQHLNPGVYLYVVAQDGNEAEQIRVHLQNKLANKLLTSVALQVNGFTAFLHNRAHIDWLAS